MPWFVRIRMSTNGYPFLSRRQILARIASDAAFAIECVRLIESRHAWMASHRAAAAKLIARLDAGPVDATTSAEALRLASRYSKTLARIIRERDLAERPELVAIGAVFGVAGVGPAAQPDVPATVEVSVATKNTSSPEAASEPTPSKKRGRPKGSKTRAKDEPKPRRRTRA